ncbi:adenylate kinase [Candidatus Bathyarchaeota archaeon]|nr:adenylate kinase [Candidatus Bathyarchaeota archaeon]
MIGLKAIVAVTGIPGVGKTTVLNEFEKLAKEKGINLKVVNFGSVMKKILEERGKSIHRDYIRKTDIELQKEVQKEACKRIRETLGEGSNLIVDTHMFVQTGFGMYPGLPLNVLKELTPSLIVLIESPPEEIVRRRELDESRIRDENLPSEVKFDIEWSRAIASACSVISGAPVKIIINERGKQTEAAKHLLDCILKFLVN